MCLSWAHLACCACRPIEHDPQGTWCPNQPAGAGEAMSRVPSSPSDLGPSRAIGSDARSDPALAQAYGDGTPGITPVHKGLHCERQGTGTPAVGWGCTHLQRGRHGEEQYGVQHGVPAIIAAQQGVLTECVEMHGLQALKHSSVLAEGQLSL
jgi:hypothetical protein